METTKRDRHVSVMVTKETRQRLDKIAEKYGRTVSSITGILVLLALENGLLEGSRFDI